MKKIMLMLAGLAALLALGLLIVGVTGAEAPRSGIEVRAGGTQGGYSSAEGASGNGLGAQAVPGASASPTACTVTYSYTVSGGSLLPATNVLTSCSVCITQVSLPFPFTFYGQTYTSAEVESQGNIQFNTADTSFPSCPFPIAQLGPAMLPYWSAFQTHWYGTGDPCEQNYGIPCGVYTSTTGSAPDRVFTVRWVGVLEGSNHETVNFEALLHETTGIIDFVYGLGIMFGSQGSVGVQDGTNQFVSYACWTEAPLQGLDIRWTPSGGPCVPNTPTATRTATNTPTRTPSPTNTLPPTATPTISCGLDWRIVQSQNVGQTSSLYGVAAIASNDVWAVGSSANPSVPFLQHWNGAQWTLPSPTPLAGTSHWLDSADGVASNDVWAVGRYQTGSGSNTLTLHWDGSVWSWILSPNGTGSTVNELASVSALASNDVWAVGFQNNGTYINHTLIEHWNGSTWSVVPSPDVNGNGYLRGVQALAPNNVWAVGNYIQDLVNYIAQPLILHWDGNAWSVFSGPTLQWGGRLQGVSAITASDMWAVGAYAETSTSYDNRTLTMHWNGTAWNVVPSPNVGTYENHLWAVSALASDDVWAVGTFNLPSVQRSLAMRWDGTAWTMATLPNPNPNPSPSATPPSNNVFGVAVVAPDDVWAVGSFENAGEYQSLTLHLSRGGCETATPTPTRTITPTSTRTATPTPTSSCPPSWVTIPSQNLTGSNQLTSVAAISSSDVWAVGRAVTGSMQGIVEHWNGSQWSIVPYVHAGFTDRLDGVSAIASNDVWIVGWYEGSFSGTLIEHWNGTQWNLVQSPNGTGYYNALTSVYARTSTDLWAVGYQITTNGVQQTLILHGNGTGWALVGSPNVNGTGYLSGVWAAAANDAWAVGSVPGGSSRPMVLHWDGTQWSVAPIPAFSTFSALYSVAGVSANDIWAVGEYATETGARMTLTMHWDGSAWTIVPSPNVGTESSSLFGVDALTSNDVWAVGRYWASGTEWTLTMHWDGSAWTVIPSPTPNTGAVYLAVSMLSSNQVWAVGYTDTAPTTSTLTALYAPWGPCGSVTPSPTNTLGPASATVVTTTTPEATITAAATSASTSTATPGPPNATATGTAIGNATATPTVPPIAITLTPTRTQISVTSTPTTCAIQFRDVPQGSTFYSYIHCLVCLGIINGYADGTFHPNANVTRGQLSKIVSNSAGLNDPQTTQIFQDVPVGSTFFQYIGRLASRGYMHGYPCGGPGEPCGPSRLPYFRPNNDATRGQISKIVSNAAGFNDPPGTQIFEDVPPGSTFYDYIQRLASRGVMSGYPCGGAGEPCVPPANLPYFRPSNNATRGQTSKIVSNTFFPDCQALQARR